MRVEGKTFFFFFQLDMKVVSCLSLGNTHSTGTQTWQRNYYYCSCCRLLLPLNERFSVPVSYSIIDASHVGYCLIAHFAPVLCCNSSITVLYTHSLVLAPIKSIGPSTAPGNYKSSKLLYICLVQNMSFLRGFPVIYSKFFWPLSEDPLRCCELQYVLLHEISLW